MAKKTELMSTKSNSNVNMIFPYCIFVFIEYWKQFLRIFWKKKCKLLKKAEREWRNTDNGDSAENDAEEKENPQQIYNDSN